MSHGYCEIKCRTSKPHRAASWAHRTLPVAGDHRAWSSTTSILAQSFRHLSPWCRHRCPRRVLVLGSMAHVSICQNQQKNRRPYVLKVLKALRDAVCMGTCFVGSHGRMERCNNLSSAGDLSTMYDIHACLLRSVSTLRKMI